MIKRPHAQWSNLTNYSPHEARAEDATSSCSRRKLVPLSFLAKEKFRCQIVWTFPFFPHWRTDRQTLYHVSQSCCSWPAGAWGMRHVARGIHKLKCGRVSWESKWGKSQTADHRPVRSPSHSRGSCKSCKPGKKKKYVPKRREEKRVTAFCLFFSFPPSLLHFLLHPQFWMMANFVFDFCALRDAVCSWQIFSLSDFWQRLLWPTGRLCHLGASQQCIKCAPGWVCVSHCVCVCVPCVRHTSCFVWAQFVSDLKGNAAYAQFGSKLETRAEISVEDTFPKLK